MAQRKSIYEVCFHSLNYFPRKRNCIFLAWMDGNYGFYPNRDLESPNEEVIKRKKDVILEHYYGKYLISLQSF